MKIVEMVVVLRQWDEGDAPEGELTVVITPGRVEVREPAPSETRLLGAHVTRGEETDLEVLAERIVRHLSAQLDAVPVRATVPAPEASGNGGD